MGKKWKILVISFLLLMTGCWLLSNSILRGIGNFLVYEDELKKCEALFVLGGGAYDRGNEAVKIFRQGFADKVVCTSGNILPDHEILGLAFTESELTRMNIIRQGVPENTVIAIEEGTSTQEESGIILDYCKRHHIHSCIVLSSKFHTRRIKMVFSEKKEKANADLIIRGAPSSQYEEASWWKSEEGLIMVNNEYMKLLYYWIKY